MGLSVRTRKTRRARDPAAGAGPDEPATDLVEATRRPTQLGSTTDNGAPAASDRNSLTLGPDGPILLDDVHFLNQMAHLYLMGDRGIPKTLRRKYGYGSHTYLWINAAGEKQWVKYHFHSNQGCRGSQGRRRNTDRR